MKALPTLLLVLTPCFVLKAQEGTIIGQVKDEANQPLVGTAIQLKGTSLGTATNVAGKYIITQVPPGKYTLKASSIGYADKEFTVKVNSDQTVDLNFSMTESTEQIQEVVIRGETEATLVSRQPITITALDANLLRSQALGVTEVLKRATGVLVRRSGGLGSDAQVNLNGLTGNAVRLYFDGIPLEYFGGGVELNNLPVNLIDRVEVYKGVMPISIGTDALGGGVNIVPRQTIDDYLEASYEIGSFNTHRTSVLGLKNLSNGFFIGINSFFNYSDNDYEMQDIRSNSVEAFEQIVNGETVTNYRTVQSIIDARRFHDRHISAFAELQVGLRNKSWADELVLSTAYSYRHDEIQHGPVVRETPAGEATRELSSFIQKVRYKKLLGQNVELDYFGMYALTNDVADDSTKNFYDWTGTILPIPNNSGSEVTGRPTNRNANNLGTTHRVTASWKLSNKHKLTASNFYSFLRQVGDDPYGIRLEIQEEELDPNTVPSKFSKNILGFELTSSWIKDKFSSIVFYKNYDYSARSIDITQERVDVLPTRNNEANNHGQGLALKYEFNPNLFIRTSYERTVRIPNEAEIYGNFTTILPNYEIRPEQSDNLNLGLFAQHNWDSHRTISIDINGFLRDQKDLIRLDALAAGELARFINEDQAEAIGLELSARAQPLKPLDITFNFTYQNVTLAESDQVQNDSFVGVQIPNIPDLFFNSSVQYSKSSLWKEDDDFRLFWNYFFVDQFSVTYVINEDNANPDNLVPTQNQHDVGFSYAPKPQGLSFSFQVNNVLNEQVFDNFRIPKPGRNYLLKISYFM